MGHKRWQPPPLLEGPQGEAFKESMIQYVEGYILALTDVQRDINQTMIAVQTSDDAVHAIQLIQAEVTASLRRARASLRMWKGLEDEPEVDDAATD